MLRFQFDRPSAGMSPDAPKKTGFALFVDIMYRELWPMLWLNVWFLLYSLPIVTIGASYGAMYTVLMRMVRDKPVDAGPEFRKAFRENFKKSTGLYFLQGVVTFILVCSFHFYGVLYPSLETIVLMLGGLFALMNLYLYPLLVTVELKLSHIVKNSFFLLFLNLKYTLILGVIWGGLGWVNYRLAPYSIFGMLFPMPVFMSYLTCFLTYGAIAKFCFPREEEEKEKVLEEGDEMALLDQELERLKAIQQEDQSSQ